MSDITLTDEQNSAVKEIKEWYKGGRKTKQVFRLDGYAGTGKEQPLTASIQTPTGPIAMGDIRVGDVIFGSNGQHTTVTGVFPQGIKPVYRVTFRDKHYTECGIEHLWEVTTPQAQFAGLPSKILSVREILSHGVIRNIGQYRYKIPLCAPVEYPKQDLLIDPYTLGVLLGDAYLHTDGYVFLSSPSRDRDILERVLHTLPDANIHEYINTRKTCSCVRIGSKTKVNELAHNIKILGLSGIKSKYKFIPKQYLLGSVEQRLAVLRGLMDTDGSCSPTSSATKFSSASFQLIQDVTQLVQSLGGTTIQTKTDKFGVYYLNIKMFVCPFLTPFKTTRWYPSIKNPPSRYIIDITELPAVEQQCITVDADDNLYLTDNFIVTHNSTIVAVVREELGVNAVSAAFTGKAANILRQKGNPGATTFHSGMYIPEEDDHGNIEFKLTFEAPFRKADLIIGDECSMINEVLAKDAESFGKKILIMGDPGQLPPVEGLGYWMQGEPDVFLRKVHRQALDSPILRFATMLRKKQKLPFGEWKDAAGHTTRVIPYSNDALHYVFRAETQPICGTNKNRWAFTQYIRELRGFEGIHPQNGEVVICCKNQAKLGIFNGSFGKLSAEPKTLSNGDYIIQVQMDDLPNVLKHMRVNGYLFKQHFDSNIKRPYGIGKATQEFDWGYILTCHKAQGSEWEDVTVIDDGSVFREDQWRWRYTAATRASKEMTYLQR